MERANGKYIQRIAYSRNIEPYREFKSKFKTTMGNNECCSNVGSLLSISRYRFGKCLSPRYWLGRLIGRFVNSIFYNDKPVPHNMSTIPTILIVDERDFMTEKEKLKHKILTFQSNGPEKCSSYPHPFLESLLLSNGVKGFINI